MRAEVATDVGLVRKNNEDAVCCDVEKQIFIVADGMGGYEAGEVASSLAVDAVYRVVSSEQTDTPLEILRQAFYQANDRIFQHAQKNPEFSGMGTTLTALWIVEQKASIVHVGDSRAYLIREGKIASLTEDHSLVGELVREGGLTEEQAMSHPQRNILTRALGCSALVEVDVKEITVKPGDYFLLCTDGLTNLVSSEEMVHIVTQFHDLKTAVHKLVGLALERGGYDNITAVLVENRP
ncbi:Stp1/IreP family PP2C-type Ser/Thr phosphatase [Candidatus Formimonas warabiya]|uniref:PPM-type phosphatase domain-containing protein n=1 Tax=Formimonas warabiya TaxID=1761012 RepID=A0A3G1KQE8_FORW1|nr:Stp1/IreP family PP2C-type Ser/Thr phosphatase [Candidatus Formimonas warabiya]ATW24693.1 hypothetical protein DCMF_07805 [Candidatus Formimonas warabiya]